MDLRACLDHTVARPRHRRHPRRAARPRALAVADLADSLGRSAAYVNSYRARLLRAGAITAPARGVVDVRDPAMRRWLNGLHPIPDFPHR